MSNSFLNAVQARRSVYVLGKKPTLSDLEIQETVEKALLQAPSAFGVQPTRLVILFGKQHDDFWDLILNTLKNRLSQEQLAITKEKIAGFKASYATILFFEDTQVVRDLEKQYPTYADKFADWSMQALGIAVYSVWSALAAEKIGASNQHYYNLVAEEVHQRWDIPKNWRLLGEMPIGHIITTPQAKQPIDIKSFVKVHK